MDKPLTEVFEIPAYPRPDENKPIPQFWKILDSDHLKQALVFFILTELRTCDVAKLNNAECRVLLSRCQSYSMMLDFKNAFIAKMEKDKEREIENQDLDDLNLTEEDEMP